MRSQFLTCIAVVILSLCPRLVSEARAANPKSKAAKATDKAADKKTPTELHADDKSMKKQMQWEDKVMGPDSNRADLARVARAHALNEKAIKDREAQAAREAAAPPPPVVAKSASKRAEVALPSVSDGAGSNKSDSNVRPREVSSKLASDEAKAPPPAVKPADDKFIDKLLRDEQESSASNASKKKSASGSDRDLDRLLAGANEKRVGRRDDVDKLLKSADSGPAMPAPRAPSALPAWTQQPDISSTPAPAVVGAAPAPGRTQKRNDGVIRVVQGNTTGVASTSVAAAEPAPSRASRPQRTSVTRTPVASNWNDPFADKPGSSTPSTPSSTPPSTPSSTSASARKVTASHSTAASSEWNDPFADKAEGKTTRRSSSSASPTSAPAKRGDKSTDPNAHPTGWKDPFTKAPSAAPQPRVAMREPSKLENARWDVATHRAAPKVAAAETHQGWGVLKKRAR